MFGTCRLIQIKNINYIVSPHLSFLVKTGLPQKNLRAHALREDLISEKPHAVHVIVVDISTREEGLLYESGKN